MTQTQLVLMGVAGCGKSSVARALQDALGWSSAEGDDLHSRTSIAKMSAGIPLTDQDRWPWLDAIAAWTTGEHTAGRNCIVTCSSLRRAYRDRLRAVPGRTVFLHLHGPAATLAARMEARSGHFMPPSLLASQFAILEPLEADEAGVTLDIRQSIPEIVATALRYLDAHRPLTGAGARE